MLKCELLMEVPYYLGVLVSAAVSLFFFFKQNLYIVFSSIINCIEPLKWNKILSAFMPVYAYGYIIDGIETHAFLGFCPTSGVYTALIFLHIDNDRAPHKYMNKLFL